MNDMEYEEMCKMVFRKEVVDWEIRAIKCKRRQLVQARQISIYLGNWFWPGMDNGSLVAPFNQDRVSAIHAIKTIKALMYSDKLVKQRVGRYLNQIRKKMNEEKQAALLEEMYMENDCYVNN